MTKGIQGRSSSDRAEDLARRERERALLTPVELPRMSIDLAAYRRLCALRDRLVAEDPTILDGEEDTNYAAYGMDTAIYVAIMQGLRVSEAEDGVEFDENTGRPMPKPDPTA